MPDALANKAEARAGLLKALRLAISKKNEASTTKAIVEKVASAPAAFAAATSGGGFVGRMHPEPPPNMSGVFDGVDGTTAVVEAPPQASVVAAFPAGTPGSGLVGRLLPQPHPTPGSPIDVDGMMELFGSSPVMKLLYPSQPAPLNHPAAAIPGSPLLHLPAAAVPGSPLIDMLGAAFGHMVSAADQLRAEQAAEAKRAEAARLAQAAEAEQAQAARQAQAAETDRAAAAHAESMKAHHATQQHVASGFAAQTNLLEAQAIKSTADRKAHQKRAREQRQKELTAEREREELLDAEAEDKAALETSRHNTLFAAVEASASRSTAHRETEAAAEAPVTDTEVAAEATEDEAPEEPIPSTPNDTHVRRVFTERMVDAEDMHIERCAKRGAASTSKSAAAKAPRSAAKAMASGSAAANGQRVSHRPGLR